MDNRVNKIRILLCDDHTLFRSGIIRILNDDSELYLIGEAENGRDLINKYFKLKPDLILTDISMPGMNGTDAVIAIKQRDPKVKVLFLSIYDGDEYIYHTFKAGGMGLVNKNITTRELSYAIKEVYGGQFYFGPGNDQKKLDLIIKRYDRIEPHIKNKYLNFVTEREKEILILIGQALTSNEIAERLNLSRRTIDSHRTNLMQKLRLKSLPELITYAVHYNVELGKDTKD